jgi:hypothetical protein
VSSSDGPAGDDLRSRGEHAVRAAWYLGVVTALSGAGVWILHRFELGALVAVLSGIGYWEAIVRAQFHAYITHVQGVISPTIAGQLEASR